MSVCLCGHLAEDHTAYSGACDGTTVYRGERGDEIEHCRCAIYEPEIDEEGEN